MRTVEISDEVFERAEKEALAKGVPVGRLIEGLVEQGIPPEPKATGHRVKFPLIHSDVPGKLHITKEIIDQVELEDDLRRSGLFGYE